LTPQISSQGNSATELDLLAIGFTINAQEVIADYLRTEVRRDTLRQLAPSQFNSRSSAFNQYFECSPTRYA
jgi:hypothetical protein